MRPPVLRALVALPGAGCLVPLDTAQRLFGEGEQAAAIEELLQVQEPRWSQEELADAPHAVVRGEVAGDCAGRVRVDLVASRVGPGRTEPPLASVFLDVAGPFEMLVPAERGRARLTALCDTDGDGLFGGPGDVPSPPVALPDDAEAAVRLVVPPAPAQGGAPGPGGAPGGAAPREGSPPPPRAGSGGPASGPPPPAAPGRPSPAPAGGAADAG